MLTFVSNVRTNGTQWNFIDILVKIFIHLVAFLDLLWLQDYFVFSGFVFIFDKLAISYFTFKIHL